MYTTYFYVHLSTYDLREHVTEVYVELCGVYCNRKVHGAALGRDIFLG